MGRWLESQGIYLKDARWISIKPIDDKNIEITVQYTVESKKPTKTFKYNFLVINNEGNPIIELVEEWGDWGGPIKVGDGLEVTTK